MRIKSRTIIGLATVLLALIPPPVSAVSVHQLSEEEIALLQTTLERLGPIVEERKQAGTAPLLTFEELFAPLDRAQIQFLEQIRVVDPDSLGGSSKKLPLPTGSERFVRLDSQTVWRQGTAQKIDAQYLPELVYESYAAMMRAMEEDLGKRLLVESGYRAPAYQLYLFLYYMPKHGYSIQETNRFVALPGCSEHGAPSRQAIDFITPSGINGEDRPEEFEELQEYTWLLNRAHEFGFRLSYPRGGASAFEPWHWHWLQQSERAAPGPSGHWLRQSEGTAPGPSGHWEAKTADVGDAPE